MSRATVILSSDAQRHAVIKAVRDAPWNTRVELKGPKRTLPQNDRLWAMLTDVARQALWAGEKRSTHDWKDLFTAAVKVAGGVQAVPGLEGGLMLLGLHTSDMSKAEMVELLDYIEAWGAQNGVIFHDGKEGLAEQAPPAAA